MAEMLKALVLASLACGPQSPQLHRETRVPTTLSLPIFANKTPDWVVDDRAKTEYIYNVKANCVSVISKLTKQIPPGWDVIETKPGWLVFRHDFQSGTIGRCVVITGGSKVGETLAPIKGTQENWTAIVVTEYRS